MRDLFHQIEDTIVAISSPPGTGGRGVVRLSGPRAAELADRVFSPDHGPRMTEAPGHSRWMGRVRVDGADVPAEAYVFRAPASYTRQNTVELHTVASPPLLAMIVDHLLSAGARAAQPGEFTARAFFNGALDLTRVEGVAAAIAARSDAELRAAQHLLHGGLGRRMSAWREALADLLALVEAEIDFVDEAISFVNVAELCTQLEAGLADIRAALAGSVALERLEVLPEVVLVGPSNAGKSTLFNGLTGTDRAIRSAVAGTTRDVLRAPVNLPGGEIALLDSAGLGEATQLSPESAFIDQLAQEATRRALQSADLLLCVVDLSAPPAEAAGFWAALPPREAILVGTKLDLVARDRRRDALEAARPRNLPGKGAANMPALAVSAVSGEGITELRFLLNERLFTEGKHRGTDVVALTARQHQSLHEAAASLERGLGLIARAESLSACAELVAIELREAVGALSLLTGDVTTEDLLGRIFARFCIGK